VQRVKSEPHRVPQATRYASRAARIAEADQRRAKRIASSLSKYYRAHGRDFPWRRSSDPYAVAVAEILLTKTKASTVVDQWHRLLHEYPTPRHLAAANAQRVEEMIRPLGLAKKRAAHLVGLGELLARTGTKALASRDLALQAPGLGAYAAAAVACFLYGAPVGIVDSNVRRVLTRVFKIRHPKTQRGNIRRLTALADLIAGSSPSPRETNYGLLDLAAAVCKPVPICPICPLRGGCRYAESRLRATPHL
jgi:A/G-specific adenine glycosylase